MPMTAARPFSAYLHLWSLANLLRISVAWNAGTGLVGSTLDKGAVALPILILLSGSCPARWSGALPFAALFVRAATNMVKGSMMSNSQMWATQMDAALLLTLLTCARGRWQRHRGAAALAAPLTTDEEHAIISSCSKTIRWQLSIFYFASGFWKVNTSFLHVDYSCASLFTVQPLEYLPDSILFATEGFFGAAVPRLARFIALIGPAATLVIESVVPALHLLDPKRFPVGAVVGVASTLTFHLVIGLTPPPSNVSSFGVTTCTRLFFMLPDGLTAAVEELKGGGGGGGGGVGHGRGRGRAVAAAMAAAAAASLALVGPFHRSAVSTVQGEGVDWHLAYYACLCVLFGRACALELTAAAAAPAAKGETPTREERVGAVGAEGERPLYRRLVALSLIYAFALPIAGLQEKAGAPRLGSAQVAQPTPCAAAPSVSHPLP